MSLDVLDPPVGDFLRSRGGLDKQQRVALHHHVAALIADPGRPIFLGGRVLDVPALPSLRTFGSGMDRCVKPIGLGFSAISRSLSWIDCESTPVRVSASTSISRLSLTDSLSSVPWAWERSPWAPPIVKEERRHHSTNGPGPQ